MIFAAVGTQLPFPRLIDALETVAGKHRLDVVIQTGDAARTSGVMTCHTRIAPDQFNALAARCDVIVGHAGIGIIIAAATHEKPLVLMPRRASLGEHRNDHQLATANHFRDRRGIVIVENAEELEAALTGGQLEPLRFSDAGPRERLIGALRADIAA